MTENTQSAPANGEDHDAALKLNQRALKIAAETFTGDVRNIILDDMKNRKSPVAWDMRGEVEQMSTISQVNMLAEHIVRSVVEIVAAGGRKTVRATLNKISIKDGIKAELELSKFDEQRHQLYDAQGATVMIVIADSEIYEGERAPVPITKRQSEMFKEGEQRAAQQKAETVTPL